LSGPAAVSVEGSGRPSAPRRAASRRDHVLRAIRPKPCLAACRHPFASALVG
jgi:hypothetical protein